jgi:hypothetical protein
MISKIISQLDNHDYHDKQSISHASDENDVNNVGYRTSWETFFEAILPAPPSPNGGCGR